MRAMIRHIFMLLVMSLTVTAAWGSNVRLTVQTGRGQREIAVGDIFYISYEIVNSEAKPETPSSAPGAKVMYFDCTGQSSSYSSINGKATQTYSFTYTLTLKAQKEGSYTFGPVTVGGTQSNSVSYTIGKAQAPSGPAQGAPQAQPSQDDDGNQGPKFIGKGDGNLFLKADVSRASVYEQEAVVYTVKLYTTYDAIKFIGATAAPKFEGFVVEESKDVSNQLEYETYKGKTYATAIIARYIIFPQMQGKLKVTGNTYTVSVDQREYYHDPFWGNMSVAKPLQLNVTPNDLEIDVKSLPVPRPADFSGGVGNFTITSSLPAQSFTSNHAASIVYTVSGTGNIKYVKLPDLNALYPPQLEVYSPSPDVQTQVGRTEVSGTARFDYTFMPLEAGSYTIPKVELCYFNPSTGKYERSVAPGYEIEVDKGKGSEKSQTRGNLTFDQELQPVKDNLKFTHTPYVETFGYWLFFIIPIVILCSVAVYYRAYLKANADLLAVKSRKANKMAAKRLRKASVCMKNGETEKFYDEMLAALWGYLGDKLKMPMSELNRENVTGQLTSRGVTGESVSRLIALIDDCELAKYAPGINSGNMPAVYDEGVKVINGLEDSFKALKHKSVKPESEEDEYSYKG